MIFKDVLKSLPNSKYKKLLKDSADCYTEFFETDLKNLFDGWEVFETDNQIVEMIKSAFQAGYVLGKTNRKQKHD